MSAARLPPALLALSPGDLSSRDLPRFEGRVALALDAGLRGVLLREARLCDRDYLHLALELAGALADVGGWLGVHDRAHLVRPSAAHGLHLGFRSLDVSEARSLVGPARAIGRSTHAGDAGDSWTGADYRFLGPIFDTPSKRGLLAPVGTAGLRRAVRSDATPLWALGGVQPANVPELIAAGARGVAVLSGILTAARVGAATRAYLDAWSDSAVSGVPETDDTEAEP